MKLFKVKCQTSNVFYAFVIAGNEIEAKKIAEEEMKEYTRIICTCSQDDI